jgi:acetyl-CoA synthetase
MDQIIALPNWAGEAKMQRADYDAQAALALVQPDSFWLERARRLDWIVAPTVADESSFDEADFQVRWFDDGVLNVAANCLDRHLATRADQTAILWEPDDPAEPSRAISYAELHAGSAASPMCSRSSARIAAAVSPSTCR